MLRVVSVGWDSLGVSDFDKLVGGFSEKRGALVVATEPSVLELGIVDDTKVLFPVTCDVESGADSFLMDPIALVLTLSSSNPLGVGDIVMFVTFES